MPRRWTNYDWCNIVTKNKLWIVRPVENEKEFMFRMIDCDPFKGLVGVPTNSFKLVFYQKSGVYSNSHVGLVN
jgi:hypothetical protein